MTERAWFSKAEGLRNREVIFEIDFPLEKIDRSR